MLGRLCTPPERSLTYHNQVSMDSLENNDDVLLRKKAQPMNWTEEEDIMLLQLLEKYDYKKWSSIAQELSEAFPYRARRTSNQCIQRWTRVLNPKIVKGKWTPEEDLMLCEAIQHCQDKSWKSIAALVPGRTDIQVRYRVQKLKKQI